MSYRRPTVVYAPHGSLCRPRPPTTPAFYRSCTPNLLQRLFFVEIFLWTVNRRVQRAESGKIELLTRAAS